MKSRGNRSGHQSLSKHTRFAMILTVILGTLSIFQAPPALAELPSVKIKTGNLIAPSAANTYFGSATINSYGLCALKPDSSLTQEQLDAGLSFCQAGRPTHIVELARSLGAGRDTNDDYSLHVFEYVYNNIDMEFRYGVGKGALGALLDQSGTPFDQAHLMVELLEEGGVSATYKAGTIALNGTQFYDWAGITDAKAACRLLADGGIPATINGSTSSTCSYSGAVTTVTLGHIWVSANGKLYDPAYKKHIIKQGIDLAAAMQCGAGCGPAAVSALVGGATTGTNYLENANTSSLANTLKGFAQNLQNYIQSNSSAAAIEDIVGGMEIDSAGLPVPAASLPYGATAVRSWTGGIPNQYRTTLRVKFDSSDTTFFMDEVYEKRLLLDVDHCTLAACDRWHRLTVEYLPIMESWITNPTLSNDDLTLEIDHPYAASASGGTANGSYMDETQVQTTELAYATNQNFPGGRSQNQIIAGLGRSGAGLMKYRADLFDNDWGWYGGTGMTGTWCSDGFYPSRSTTIVSWLAEMSEGLELAGAINKSRFQHHHSLGYVEQYTALIISVESAVSVTSETGDADDRRSAIHAGAAMMSALEGSVMAQNKESWDGGGSASGYFSLANTRAHRFMNIEAGGNTSGLINYGGVDLAAIQSYLSSGYKVVLPKDGALGSWSNGGVTITYQYSPFVATKGDESRLAYVPDAGMKGAGIVTPENPAVALEKLKDIAAADTQLVQPEVDLTSGALTLAEGPDIVTGSGGFPFALPFQRSYSSALGMPNFCSGRTTWNGTTPTTTFDILPLEKPLPTGWTHNFEISAAYTGDPFQSMGADSALDAVWTIAGLFSLSEMLHVSDGFHERLTAIFTVDWVVDRLEDSAFIVKGPSPATFMYLPDGSFNPPPGSQQSVVRTGSRINVVAPGRLSYDYTGVSFDVFDGGGAKLEFKTYTDLQRTQIDEAYGSGSSGTESRIFDNQFLPTTWVFPNAVTVDFEYDINYDAATGSLVRFHLAKVSNNLGRHLAFTYETDLVADFENFYRHLTVADENSRQVVFSALGFGPFSWTAPFSKVQRPDGSIRVYSSVGVGVSKEADIADFLLWKLSRPKEHRLASVAWTNSGSTTPYDQLTAQWVASYDTLYRVKSVADANGYQTQYFPGRASTEQFSRGEGEDPLGNITTVYANENGSSLQTIDPLGRATSNIYDGAGRLIESIAPEGNAARYTYDSRSNVIEARQKPKPSASPLPADIVVSAAYPAACSNKKTCNKPTSITDAEANTTSYAYSSSTGQLTSITKPAVTGGTPKTTLAYTTDSGSGVSLLTSSTTRLGSSSDTVTTAYAYHTLANHLALEGITLDSGSGGLGLKTSFSYDAPGNMTTLNGPHTSFSDLTTYTYDAARRLTQSSGLLGANTQYTYTLKGQIEETKRATSDTGNPSQITTNIYDAAGQLIKVMDPQFNFATTSYDAAGRADIVTDAELRKTRFIYYADGSVNKIIRAYGDVQLQQDYATYTYTDNGQQASVVDANGNTTTYTYDGFDRLEKTTFPDGSDEQSSYDDNGNVTSFINRMSEPIARAYDSNNRLITETFPSAPNVTYGYDLAARLTSVAHTGTAVELTYAYDKAGRTTSAVSDDGATARTIVYQYNKAGNRTRLIWPDGYYVSYDYDNLDRLSGVTEVDGGISTVLATHIYDKLSRRIRTDYGNGTNTLLAYELDDDLSDLDHTLPGSGNILFNYGYNKVHQLTSDWVNTAAYQWSPVGTGPVVYTHNNLNQYEAVGGNAFTYDAKGNLLSDSVNSYAYDTLNRLTSAVAVIGGVTNNVTYEYDPQGRRSAKVVNGTRTEYLLDEGEEIAEYDGTTLLRRYVYDVGVDRPVAMVDEPSGERFYYHQNRLGSVIALSDAAGVDIEPSAYSPYGISAISSGNPFRYTGRRLDEETGLYYYRARYYSPKVGRFLQTDPIGYKDGLNLYAYVGNDPVNATDPSGQELRYISSNGGDVGDIERSIAYLKRSETASGEIFQLEQSKRIYTINVDPTVVGKEFFYKTHTIDFNPNDALVVKSSGKVQTPALTLGHEISHAAEFDRKGVEEFIKNLKRPIVRDPLAPPNSDITLYGIAKEEERATYIEGHIARELGEPAREDYRDTRESVETCGPLRTDTILCRSRRWR